MLETRLDFSLSLNSGSYAPLGHSAEGIQFPELPQSKEKGERVSHLVNV